MPMIARTFQLSMVSNAEDSLKRGYEVLVDGLRAANPYSVKEAIIWVHHGVELVLKQLLLDKASEYLIFENIDEAVRKTENLRYHNGITGATSVQLFEHTSTRTVGYDQLLSRVAVILDIGDLALGSTLRDDLGELSSVRNEIVHSPSELNLQEAATLLERIGEPLLNLIAEEAGDSGLTYAASMSIRGSLSSAGYLVTHCEPRFTDSEQRILSLVGRFRGQQVPGSMFRRADELTLPDFSQADIHRETGYQNFIVEGQNKRWIVSVEHGYANKEQMLVKKELAARSQVDELWVAGATTHPYVYPDVLVSSQEDVDRLEEILADGT